MDWKKYNSRKFIIVLLILFATVGLALLEKMTGDVSSVLTGLAIAYPVAQGAVDWKQSGSK